MKTPHYKSTPTDKNRIWSNGHRPINLGCNQHDRKKNIVNILAIHGKEVMKHVDFGDEYGPWGDQCSWFLWVFLAYANFH